MNPRANNLMDRVVQEKDASKAAETIYLTVFTRMPDAEEKAEVAKAFQAKDKSAALRDLLGFTQTTGSGANGKVVLIYPAERMNTITANTTGRSTATTGTTIHPSCEKIIRTATTAFGRDAQRGRVPALVAATTTT